MTERIRKKPPTLEEVKEAMKNPYADVSETPPTMTERERFESTFPTMDLRKDGNGQYMNADTAKAEAVWDACAEIKDKEIAEITAELKTQLNLAIDFGDKCEAQEQEIAELKEKAKEAGRLELQNGQLYIRETSRLTLKILSLKKKIDEIKAIVYNPDDVEHRMISKIKQLWEDL